MSAPACQRALDAAEIRRWIQRNLVFTIVFAAVLFGCAGRFNWWAAWAYIAMTVGIIVTTFVVLRRISPDLLVERSRMQPGTKSWDKWLAPMITIAGTLSMWIVAGLDARFGWTEPHPIGLVVLAFIVGGAGGLLTLWAMTSNRFFASTVRIQTERRHHVVDSGPYRKVRHPGYTGAGLYSLMTPFALGSRPALIPALLILLLLAVRTYLEDRMLQRELPGYLAYAKQVPNRLVPYIW